MDAVKERLEVAAEQLREVRETNKSSGQDYRLEIALQAVQSAISLLKTAPTSTSEQLPREEEFRDGFPIKIICKCRTMNSSKQANEVNFVEKHIKCCFGLTKTPLNSIQKSSRVQTFCGIRITITATSTRIIPCVCGEFARGKKNWFVQIQKMSSQVGK